MSSESRSPEAAREDAEIVYTTTSKNRTLQYGAQKIFHTNRDCFNLQKGGDVQEHRRDLLTNGWRECKACSGEAEITGENQNRTCPNCGEPTGNLPNHIRGCDG